jgi:hypothetical protein
MGLTISYTLSTNRKPAEALLLRMVEQTAQLARKIGCPEVQGPQAGGPDHWKMWKLPDGSTTGEPVSALEGWSVCVLPGEGCETAQFGLCRYPGIKGWKLTSWCKTQYAARHGIQHFLDSHRRVICLLDLWRDFGVKLDVCDEGEFWQSRSIEQLVRRVGVYDRMVAAVAGALKDQTLQGDSPVKAEILNDSRFERLEAEGRQEFADEIGQLLGLLRDPKRKA